MKDIDDPTNSLRYISVKYIRSVEMTQVCIHKDLSEREYYFIPGNYVEECEKKIRNTYRVYKNLYADFGIDFDFYKSNFRGLYKQVLTHFFGHKGLQFFSTDEYFTDTKFCLELTEVHIESTDLLRYIIDRSNIRVDRIANEHNIESEVLIPYSVIDNYLLGIIEKAFPDQILEYDKRGLTLYEMSEMSEPSKSSLLELIPVYALCYLTERGEFMNCIRRECAVRLQ